MISIMKEVILVSFLSLWLDCSAFVTPSIHQQRANAISTLCPKVTSMNLLSRFRKKREVEAAETISPGSTFPKDGAIIEMLVLGKDGKPTTETVSIQEALGEGKSLLVGMPGAFTPTCTSEHLPGYIFAAPKLHELGVNKIAILTTNDRFVNEEWARKTGLFSDEAVQESASTDVLPPPVTLLADGDADFVKSVGMAEDMGFGIGIRSKRFVMLVENGTTVEEIFTDEGMEECKYTSAAAVVKYLTPEGAEGENFSLSDEQGKLVGGGVAVLALLWFATSIMGGGSEETVSTVAPTVKSAVPAVAPVIKSSGQGSFELLKTYIQ